MLPLIRVNAETICSHRRQQQTQQTFHVQLLRDAYPDASNIEAGFELLWKGKLHTAPAVGKCTGTAPTAKYHLNRRDFFPKFFGDYSAMGFNRLTMLVGRCRVKKSGK